MYYIIGCLETKLKCGTFICHSGRDLWQDHASNYSSRDPRLCHITIIITPTDICYTLNYDTALNMSTLPPSNTHKNNRTKAATFELGGCGVVEFIYVAKL